MPLGRIVREEIDLSKESAEMLTPGAGGALVVFVGFVKGVVDGKEVKELEYSSYDPYASEKLKEIAQEESRGEKVLDVRIYHRVGRLKPGDPTVYILVSAVNRGIAFSTAQRVLERIKREVPIFKLEKREDGEYWVMGQTRIRRTEVSGELSKQI